MLEYGLEWHSLDTYMQFKELSSAPGTPESNQIRQYATDSSGTSTMCWKNDAGNVICLPTTSGTLGFGSVTGTGANTRVTFWTGTTTLGSNANFTYDAARTAGLGALLLQAEGADNNARYEARITGQAPGFQGKSSGGGTLASPTASGADNFLCFLGGSGTDNSPAFVTANRVLIGLKSAEAWTTTAQGTYITFETTPTSSTTRAEVARINPIGYFGLGATDPAFRIDIRGTDNAGTVISIKRAGADANSPGGLAMLKARGTLGSEAATNSGDTLGNIGFGGWTNAYAFNSSRIEAVAGSLWSATNAESYMSFFTTPSGSTTRAERFRIGSAGQLGIGGATFGTSGQVLTSGGASAAPSWTTISGSGHTIRENGVDQTSRLGLNFIDTDAGAGLITDDAGGNETEVNLNLYAVLSGRSAGQTLIGSTASAGDLILQSTSHATRGTVQISDVLNSNTERSLLIGSSIFTDRPALVEIGGSWGATANNSSAFMVTTTFTGDGVGLLQGCTINPTYNVSGSTPNCWAALCIAAATPQAGATIDLLRGAFYRTDFGGNTGAVTESQTLYCESPSIGGTLKPATQKGLHIANQGASGITTAIGLRIDAQSGATNNYAAQIDGAISIADGMTAPGTLAGFAGIYVDTADGDLKVKFGDGTVKIITTDTAGPDYTTSGGSVDRSLTGGDNLTNTQNVLITLINDLITLGILT